jgi:hypothetical protein
VEVLDINPDIRAHNVTNLEFAPIRFHRIPLVGD